MDSRGAGFRSIKIATCCDLFHDAKPYADVNGSPP
eukprot:CAMPEP_0206319308 /NCGR_PEP_ID=MMETSP0106_2-20121207/17686_1 /ASSEMBLY_ACC=CAM_ASM_000206 /TAXON_ID=81532 /ORGANISM="Acanthoeca-like sp., Strain 10tr" /LENGTH=34 /DNA_ID= /DNA_START= /DNA_END= /DNA_ORIENTATION=